MQKNSPKSLMWNESYIDLSHSELLQLDKDSYKIRSIHILQLLSSELLTTKKNIVRKSTSWQSQRSQQWYLRSLSDLWDSETLGRHSEFKIWSVRYYYRRACRPSGWLFRHIEKLALELGRGVSCRDRERATAGVGHFELEMAVPGVLSPSCGLSYWRPMDERPIGVLPTYTKRSE